MRIVDWVYYRKVRPAPFPPHAPQHTRIATRLASTPSHTHGSRAPGPQGSESVPVYCQALNVVCVLFPALDTLSVFPLIAVTLGTWLAAWRARLLACFEA